MSEQPTRIGVQLAPQHTSVQATIDAARRVEEMGADAVFNWDHFFPLSGEPDGVHFEATTPLAAWAQATTTIQLGPLVFCNSYRNPELLADIARTIDQISSGRFIFGIGAGWFERDYVDYGYEFGTVVSRLDDLGAALPRITERWSKLNPPPSADMPVLIGGQGEKKTLPLVAEYAQIWHSFVGPDDLPGKIDVLRRELEARGRDMSSIEISNGASVRDGVGGTEFERLDALHALGTRLFTVPLSGDDGPGGYALDRIAAFLAWRDSKNS